MTFERSMYLATAVPLPRCMYIGEIPRHATIDSGPRALLMVVHDSIDYAAMRHALDVGCAKAWPHIELSDIEAHMIPAKLQPPLLLEVPADMPVVRVMKALASAGLTLLDTGKANRLEVVRIEDLNLQPTKDRTGL